MNFKSLAYKISLANRKKKFDLFVSELKPTKRDKVVDIGVSNFGFGGERVGNFFEAMYPWPRKITAVSNKPSKNFRQAFPKVRFVLADGRNLPFKSNQFDIAFSNAVVEHIPDRENQRIFIREICRIARHLFVTTPNRRFPLEVHTLLPFVHWLPRALRNQVFTSFGKSQYYELNPLSKGEFCALFPRPVKIINMGMTLVAIDS